MHYARSLIFDVFFCKRVVTEHIPKQQNASKVTTKTRLYYRIQNDRLCSMANQKSNSLSDWNLEILVLLVLLYYYIIPVPLEIPQISRIFQK